MANKGSNIWIIFIGAVTIGAILLLFTAGNILTDQTERWTSEVMDILENNTDYAWINDISPGELAEYSGRFDKTMEELTGKLPIPFNRYAHKYVMKRTYSALRDKVSTEIGGYQSLGAIILTASGQLIPKIILFRRIFQGITALIGLFLILLLKLHERGEIRKAARDLEARNSGRVIL